MYHNLGDHVSRYPYLWLIFWVVFSVGVIAGNPKSTFKKYEDGEFKFLPEDAPSQKARAIYLEAFTDPKPAAGEEGGTSVQQDPLGSNIVIVLRRDGPEGLSEKDRQFINEKLVPELENIQKTTPRGYEWNPEKSADYAAEIPEDKQVIRSISTLADERIGTLLVSPDKKATMVVVDLKTEFLERQNALVLGRIESLLSSIRDGQPNYLMVALSGSATVGRDMLRAEKDSASRTEAFTKGLCIVLLLLIYRAPLLALVPLVTVGVSVELSQALLRLMAEWGWIGLFTGLDVYVTVVVYGAGVDFCLFLIARYKEELDNGATHPEAISLSIRRVGAALATSAGTSIIGIGMMQFSDFGKFRQAGFAISFGLFVVLCFALTFTPAFMLILGKWVFWPRVPQEKVADQGGFLPAANVWTQLREQRFIDRFWDWIAYHLQRRPGQIFVGTVLVMLPFAALGGIFQNQLSYGLLSDLPQDDPSVVGAKAVQDHFPPGVTGPISVFMKFDRDALVKYDRDLQVKEQEGAVAEGITGRDLSVNSVAANLSSTINDNLQSALKPLGIVDIRNQKNPLGTREEPREYLASLRLPRERNAARVMAHRNYTAVQDGPLKGQVMRMDVVLDRDPFARDTISKLSEVEAAVREAVPAELRQGVEVHSLGTTAGIRDIKTTTDHDRVLIFTLVTISVYILIVILLRQPRLCLYLIISVIFSYLVTLGVTYVVFALRHPGGWRDFNGLDWKIPVYLFTILVAMGEDYNILLMSRVQEEQEHRGYVGGVLYALRKTGGIISSCGIIMAGTFFSLMSGTLLGMVEMGFALGFGVLLDTFIVRPILVPAYLILLYSGKLGWFGQLLGAPADSGIRAEPDLVDDADTRGYGQPGAASA